MTMKSGAALGTLAVLLAACGGGGASDEAQPPGEDALAPYRSQTVAWSACNERYADQARSMGIPAQTMSRVECGMLRVPMDYQDVSRGDLNIEMLRVRAAEADAQTLFLNPGGPGGSGTSLALMIGGVWSLAKDSTEVGRRTQALAQAYDLVGFAPRGVAGSTALVCPLAAPLIDADATPAGFDEQSFQDQLEHGRQVAQACQSQDIAPYINTAATVEDMELMRQVLDGGKFNYLGYSYGTWLGTWYASTYPEHVGKMVFDSSMNFTVDLFSAFGSQVPAMGRAYEDLFYPVAASRPFEFGMGRSVDEVRQAFRQIHPEVQAAVLPDIYTASGSTVGMYDSLYIIAAAKGLSEIAQATDETGGDGDVDVYALIQGYGFNGVQGEVNLARVRAYATMIYDKLVAGEDEAGNDDDLDGDGQPDVLDASGNKGTNIAVRCADTPLPSQDPAFYRQKAQQLVDEGTPFFTEQGYACLSWNRSNAVTKPDVAAMAEAKVLYVQSEYDVRTPVQGARALFGQVPGANMVYVPREANHGLYPYADECVDLNVVRYLSGEPLTQREASCASKSEDLLDTGAPLRSRARAMLADEAPDDSGTVIERTYEDPESVQRLLDGIRQQIR